MRDYSLGTVCFCIYWYGFLLICGCAGRHSLFCRTMDAPDVQQSMGYKESRGGMPKFFHALGPALLISMGYIDLGKWVAAVEAGSCFGFDLVLLALLFNFTAIVCQYLAACIGTVTGKNLAEICHQEYNQPTCIFLGVQAGLSLLTSELTMIFGIALGFNLLFEYDDLITGICFATVVPNLLPYAISHLGKKMEGTINACIAGFALLSYVLGLLVSQPQIPLTMNVIFPKISGESAYSLMALLGANIMAHNFYIHSSVVQGQKKSSAVGLGALFHDHLFSILFIFTGIFMVNYVLMNSAAAESTNTLLITFQDVVELMNQIFVNPLAPTIFLVVLLFSSHIISLTSAIGSQVISHHLFGINLPLSGHRLLLKVFAIVPTLYWAKVAGAEGIYQLLIICQIIQAMLLPSSVVPLFRVASSRSIMGGHRVSLHLEILVFLAFLLMLFSNIIFVAEMLFGDSGWMNNLKGYTGSPVVLPYTVLVLVALVSVAFSLYLAVTPLRSGSHEAESHEWSVHSQRELLNTSQEREDVKVDNVTYEEDQRSDVVPSPRDVPDSHPELALDYIDTSDTAVESDHDSQQSTAYASTAPETCSSPSFTREESKSVVAVNWPEPLEKVPTSTVMEESTVENVVSRITTERDVLVETDVVSGKDKEDIRTLESEKSIVDSTPYVSDDGPPSLTFSRGKGSDAGNGSGSLSRLSGLGRAARRQLAATLDEFWGHLFDYHGKLTQEASTKKFGILLGIDLRTPSTSVRTDKQAAEILKSPLVRDSMRGAAFLSSSVDLMSPKNETSNLELAYGLQRGPGMGLSSWSQGMQLPNTQLQSSSNSLLEQSARLNSNFSSSYSDNNQFYQPATIHGYQLTSYLKQMNASPSLYSSMPLDPQRLPKSSVSAVPNYADSMMHARNHNLLASLGGTTTQLPATSRIGSMMPERSYYDPSSVDGNENTGSPAYSKKYHSSPDMSGIIAASRAALLNEAKLGAAIGPQSYLSRLAAERSQYASSTARPAAPLAFDELSPPKLQSDIFSAQSSMRPSARSLWAKQPFEQLFGMSSAELSKGDFNLPGRSGGVAKDDFSYKESETKLLQSLRLCIMKLLKLEGSGWLFKQNGGCDEDLIDRVAAAEKLLMQGTAENQLLLHGGDLQQHSSDQAGIQYMRTLPNCGEDCVWRASLVVSFGVWCVRRVLDMSLVESRPELWGKYTYVLNRLQGILDPAFSKPRGALTICTCLQKDTRVRNSPPHSGLTAMGPVPTPLRGAFTTAGVVLEMIKDVEAAVSGRKGRSGTAAGDVAFPKGKENLASVLKRYKRRLASKGQ